MPPSALEVAMQTMASVLSDNLEEKNGVPVITKDGLKQLVEQQFPHCKKVPGRLWGREKEARKLDAGSLRGVPGTREEIPRPTEDLAVVVGREDSTVQLRGRKLPSNVDDDARILDEAIDILISVFDDLTVQVEI
ncbi:UNVERIFIED_CONTAM: hypothetical protein K2H54_022385 [Gekko kuhli]